LVHFTSSLPLLETDLKVGRDKTISKLMDESLRAESDSFLEGGKEYLANSKDQDDEDAYEWQGAIACSDRYF
jgi:hypothetical protein